ncbi:MAG: HAD family hydrolase, partial [Pseudolabrys sp.]
AMARAAGVAAIGVSWGYHPVADLHAAGADVVVDDFAQLLPALDMRWASEVCESDKPRHARA